MQNSRPADSSRSRLISIVLGGFIALVAGFTTLLGLLPPTSRDALIHHLAIPKLWIEAGGFVDTPWASFSYYPMNLDLLYLIPLSLQADWAAALIHNAFGLATGLLVFLHLQRRLNVNWGLLGALLFLGIPMIMRLAVSAYVDLGLVFFVFAAAYALVRWKDTGRRRYFFLSAVCLGLALGTKYNGLVALPLLGLGVFWLRSKTGGGMVRSGLWAAAYLAAALLVFSPWLIKNGLFTGNPTYPLFNGLWGLPGLVTGEPAIGLFQQREYLYGESFLEIVTTPVRAFFQGQDNSPQYFDGVLNPILILLPPLALFRPRHWEVRPFGIMAVAWILIVFFQAGFRIRYMAPALPFLAVLTVQGLYEFRAVAARFFRRMGGPVLAVILIGFMIPNVVWAADYWRGKNPWPFLSGRETRTEYLWRELDIYPVMECINSQTAKSARILFLFAGNRGYYCDRPYFYNTYYSGEVLKPIMTDAASGDDVRDGFKALGADYILTRDSLLLEYLKEQWPPDKVGQFMEFSGRHLKPVCRERGYSLYRIKDASE